MKHVLSFSYYKESKQRITGLREFSEAIATNRLPLDLYYSNEHNRHYLKTNQIADVLGATYTSVLLHHLDIRLPFEDFFRAGDVVYTSLDAAHKLFTDYREFTSPVLREMLFNFKEYVEQGKGF